ncbi:M48 family metalloprotease [Streptomyces sp. SCUT-3]|nr:M48 family metalloprotease [Streptomyces sp. SCUT-3]
MARLHAGGTVVSDALPSGRPVPGPAARPPQEAGNAGDAAAAGAPEVFTPQERARGRALARAQWIPVLTARAVSTALLAVLGLTPAGARIVDAASAPFGDARPVRVLCGGLALLLLLDLARLPFAARLHVVRRDAGLDTRGWGGWSADLLRGLALSLPLALGALLGLHALLAAAPDTWWAWAAAAAALGVTAVSWLAPLLLEPVFNRFTPMEPGPLRDALLGLAAADGVRVREVLVADASRRTTALNAYVSGFGATRRIVVYDTLLATAPPREVELVVAHELGHVRHRDVARGTALAALGAAAGVCALAAALRPGPLLSAAGADGLADPRSTALLLLAVAVGGALAGPFGRAAGRRAEARADRHALGLTGDAAGFVAMQRRLSVANVSDVDPPRLLHLLFGTHPSAVRRIAAAMRGDSRPCCPPARARGGGAPAAGTAGGGAGDAGAGDGR